MMHDERSHLLAQIPLTVSPFTALPKAPTLPHNYTSLPSTLPPSVLNPPPNSTQNNQEQNSSQKPQYVTSTTGFSAHPSQIAAQNSALLSQLSAQRKEAAKKIEAWEQGIRERELAEKRRRAPGWLDREEKILEPDRGSHAGDGKDTGRKEQPKVVDLMGDDVVDSDVGTKGGKSQDPTGADLGALMDKAFA